MPEIQIMPSILAADMGRLKEQFELCENSGADGLHVDIMDGTFVPNFSLGPAVVQLAHDCVDIPLDVHLMVIRPDHYTEPFIKAGADTLLIHIEADAPVEKTLEDIRAQKCRAGITLNPETPASAIRHLIEQGLLDEVLVMSVHPGFGGQSFIPGALPKIAEIRSWNADLDISVDGGINPDTAVQCASMGANMFMAGTFLFKAQDMKAEIDTLRMQTEEVYCKG